MASRWNLLLLGITAAAAACSDATSEKAAEIRAVRTLVVDPRPVEDDRSAVGEVRARYESDLGFRIAGKVTKRLVDVGSMVRRGDLLARLDDQDYRNKLTAAETDVTAAEAILVEAQAAEGRLRLLLANGHTTRANYDVAFKNLRSAEAKLLSAKAALNLAKDQLSYCELRADFDGIVTATGAEPGQIVNVGHTVVRLAQPKDKDAVFAVAETAFRERPEQPSKIVVSLLSNPAISAEGAVRETSPVADPATRTYQVKVMLKSPPEQMRFGSSVVGRLKAATAPAVVLPGSALFDKAGQAAVWVVDPASMSVSLRPVSIARYETDRVIVSDGLAKGDIVVTAGVNRLRETQRVHLAEGASQ